jgi:hypothetical protein
VTGDEVIAPHVSVNRVIGLANRLNVATTWMEIAARGWVDRTWNVPLKMDSLSIRVWVRYWNC